MNFDKYLVGLAVNKSLLTDKEIENIETEVGFLLPEDYKDFLKEVNGCEGVFNGKNYAIIWNGYDLGKYHQEYQVGNFLNGMLLIGSDGGGEAFAFDRLNEMKIVRVPFVGMERDLAVPLAETFTAFLNVLCEKAFYE